MNRRIIVLGVLAIVTLGAGASLAADGLRRPADMRRSMLQPLIGSIHLSSTGGVDCADLSGRLTAPVGGSGMVVAIVADTSGAAIMKAQPRSVGVSMQDLAPLDGQSAVGRKQPSATQGTLASPQLVCPEVP